MSLADVRPLKLLITLAALLLFSPPVWACTYADGLQILPDQAFPPEVGPDARFSVTGVVSGTPTVTVVGAQGEVALGDFVERQGAYPMTFWTVAPVEPLAAGRYTLTVEPGFGYDSVQFDVIDGVTHTSLDAEAALDVEFTDLVDDCGDATWTAVVTVTGDKLPPIAHLVGVFEMADGTEVTRAQRPSWGSDARWRTGLRSAKIAYPFGEEPVCVDLTAVLATGHEVDLGESCGRGGSGAGCATAHGSRSGLAGLLAVVVLVVLRRRRLD